MHTYGYEIPAVVPQPQLVLEMRHLSRDGGGEAAQVRDFHRAGDQERQHHRHRLDECDPVPLNSCSAVHPICAVRCEDLAAEERIFKML